MEVKLQEHKHPNPFAETAYSDLVAIDNQKNTLLNTLELFFDKIKIEEWQKKHHPKGIDFLSNLISGTPLVILSGDVGCGKTALAHSIGTPLAKSLNKRIVVFETPSNIRGAGRVGEISNRITDAFDQVKAKIKSDGQMGILIIDEADDLATDRDQNQAHHEDRAGLNVLIKQIDSLAREKVSLAVILITNRLKVLDPAVLRRATQIIEFGRPDNIQRKLVFERIFRGTELSEEDYTHLIEASKNEVPFSFSDLILKVGKQSLFYAIQNNIPFDKDVYIQIIKTIKPSPLIQSS